MTALETALSQYLRMRRDLGYKLEGQERQLKHFVTFLKGRKASYITCELALEWATQRSNRQSYWALRLSHVRAFARYLSSIDSRTEVLPSRLIPAGNRRAKPYLYTQEDIERLIDAAFKLHPQNGLKPWTYACLFGLLAVTGMRISEAMNLKLEDVDLKEGVLTIRNTKFGKTRLAALHPSSRKMLAYYLQRREAILGNTQTPYFLVGDRGKRLRFSRVYPVFHQLSRQIGLRGPDQRTGPRLHDFRHRYAVETLLRWHRVGEDIDSRLPELSAALGHTNVHDTYWYLTASPELMQRAALRLQRRSEMS